jgi:hypothetical protein
LIRAYANWTALIRITVDPDAARWPTNDWATPCRNPTTQFQFIRVDVA